MPKMIFFSLCCTLFFSCNELKNPSRPVLLEKEPGTFVTAKDRIKIFVYEYLPVSDYSCTVYIISGITGINHHTEKEVIELLANGKNRVVVIHPRGTGYSDGKRGDISVFSDFINDYVEIIKCGRDYQSKQHKTVLFGHSMSAAILLAVADKLEHCDGAILVNPPYQQKKAKGMSPTLLQYIKYASYMIFAKHKPVVNMAGNPALIENPEDRKESEQRLNDPLLVKYFSMYMMLESKKIMNLMLEFSKKADYPLLLIYGEKDNIVDQKGCELIFDRWKSDKKKYFIIENGTHGKSTVVSGKNIINKWINDINNE
ncbi:MAG TPA: hypothetical protein DCX89_03525 [Saprospirales bacterium]|nr:hypothetical protein [Saprospirales bacterium]HRQ29266.1 alpha/beta fold hydrolase [Saprospiraceae bacterium]